MSEDRKREYADRATYGGLRVSLIKIGLLLLCVGFWFLLLLLDATLNWWMLLILALPLYLAGEWVSEKVFATKYGWSTAQVGFSPRRIAFGVLLVLSLSAGVYWFLDCSIDVEAGNPTARITSHLRLTSQEVFGDEEGFDTA